MQYMYSLLNEANAEQTSEKMFPFYRDHIWGFSKST